VKNGKPKKRSRPAWSVALHKESERNDREQILRRLAMPVEKRTNFLRFRLPNGGSVL
jgi:hypothetical protein